MVFCQRRQIRNWKFFTIQICCHEQGQEFNKLPQIRGVEEKKGESYLLYGEIFFDDDNKKDEVIWWTLVLILERITRRNRTPFLLPDFSDEPFAVAVVDSECNSLGGVARGIDYEVKV
jgi:hypothetical protein